MLLLFSFLVFSQCNEEATIYADIKKMTDQQENAILKIENQNLDDKIKSGQTIHEINEDKENIEFKSEIENLHKIENVTNEENPIKEDAPGIAYHEQIEYDVQLTHNLPNNDNKLNADQRKTTENSTNEVTMVSSIIQEKDDDHNIEQYELINDTINPKKDEMDENNNKMPDVGLIDEKVVHETKEPINDDEIIFDETELILNEPKEDDENINIKDNEELHNQNNNNESDDDDTDYDGDDDEELEEEDINDEDDNKKEYEEDNIQRKNYLLNDNELQEDKIELNDDIGDPPIAYQAKLTIESVRPTILSSKGGEIVYIQTNLTRNTVVFCKFNSKVITGRYINDGQITCKAPPLQQGEVSLSVSVNRRKWGKEVFLSVIEEESDRPWMVICIGCIIIIGAIYVVAKFLFLKRRVPKRRNRVRNYDELLNTQPKVSEKERLRRRNITPEI
ncbi:hypothetical protein GPJ56_009673 [Histomonas meleagridis]|uniref:uncharacterized protein n=1 Tax=Histomonas meleagridis TaxID=135588 RepID=UPI0035596C7F|nr:hypothetical protein GPJ56_009673 [Histomonas meleagridis]KAH0805493.1 hypothetical protein GO595_001723 [Histomonas meleagridis]